MASNAMSRGGAIGAVLAGTAGLIVPASLRAEAATTANAIIDTTSGKLRGMRAGGLSRFFGIPYGENTGRHRFEPPRPLAPWAGVRDCNALGAKTPQGIITITGVMNMPRPGARGLPVIMKVAETTNARLPESEDCLILNVITPDASRKRKRPVMVWLHGSGFAMGPASMP